MVRNLALLVGLTAGLQVTLPVALPAMAGEMSAEEARHFVTGKLFSYTCFEGTRGQGRVLTNGGVVGSIQFQGSGPVRYAALPANTLQVKGSSVCASLRGLPFEPMLGENEVNVDPLKFTWLGSMNRDVSLAMSWHTSKIKTFADLQQYQLLVPGTGAGADSEILPLAFNRLAGTQFKIIEGYRDTPIAALAMERGELDGLAYWSWSSIMAAHPDWIRDKKVNLLFQTGLNPIPDVSQVPSLRNLVTNPTDKAALAFLLAREIIGRPFLAPPDLPPDRATALRSAFAATLRDPAFLQDAKRTRLDVSLVTGADVDALLKDSAGAPKDVLARVKQALGRK